MNINNHYNFVLILLFLLNDTISLSSLISAVDTFFLYLLGDDHN